ncbi:hypothetical protein [Streptomyces sp. NPDC048636]|uniref:hypothetical protein n=1 Tax=Streptomyces sp. NPDC048636 TaxID=3155762 RepID=UPI0034244BC0
MITTGGRELPQPGKRNVSITTPPPGPPYPTDVSPALSASDGPTPPRRALLLGGGALGAVALLSGCSDGSEPRHDTGGGTSVAKLRATGARESTALLARYDATVDAHPALAKRLAPLRAETARHASAFRGPERSASPSGSAAPSASPSGSASGPAATRRERPPAVPKDEKGALAALAQAERHTADARTTALVTAPPELARLLASVAACGAAHVYLLTQGGSAS